MANDQEKTEQPTPRRLEEAIKHGQFPKSSEVQTVFVMFAFVFALRMAGGETWHNLALTMSSILSHLNDNIFSINALQESFIHGVIILAKCTWPIVVAIMIAGMLAGGIQSKFQAASEALEFNINRLNPVEGLQRIFSLRSAIPTIIAAIKLSVIGILCWSLIKQILADPIFYSTVGVARIAEFMAEASIKIIIRVAFVLTFIAAIDYAYQYWRTNKDLMMTREEVKEEMKSSEQNPQIKAEQRKRRFRLLRRRMFLDTARADVVITNPTHYAVALKYDPNTMKAPIVVAKGIRLVAQKIRQIAQDNNVPIIENPPLARSLYKYTRVGGEIPAMLYAAVAEVLAWVYKINRTKYYMENNRPKTDNLLVNNLSAD